MTMCPARATSWPGPARPSLSLVPHRTSPAIRAERFSTVIVYDKAYLQFLLQLLRVFSQTKHLGINIGPTRTVSRGMYNNATVRLKSEVFALLLSMSEYSTSLRTAIISKWLLGESLHVGCPHSLYMSASLPDVSASCDRSALVRSRGTHQSLRVLMPNRSQMMERP
jgi:hypothetical protein